VEHLGTNLVVVLGHTGCGAVEAAIHHDPSGFIKYITDEIRLAIGEETDPYRASCLNVAYSVNQISHALDIDHLRHGNDPAVSGAIYHIDDGHVEFLHD
jgi:carbonic anhydrase